MTIIVPLPADPFDQAEVLEKLRPVIDRAQHDLDDNVDTPITVDRRIVRPKPAKPAGGAA
ncbi:hypothetical protein [Elioraea sp.]|uniref:hypothetical protein n=1 Tax=Elioraea sp. TaxID=2185103 RepID=UPI0025C264D8|nr:hypothetical protein [Elioraea sp.]